MQKSLLLFLGIISTVIAADSPQLLTDSAWAQKTTASISSVERETSQFPGGYPEGPNPRAGGLDTPPMVRGTPGTIRGPGPSGGGGRSGYPSATRMEVLVRWDSAEPIQAALHKASKEAENSYVISVLGLRTPVDRNPEELRSEFMSSARLIIKNNTSLTPEDVRLDTQDNGARIAQLFFSRSNPIQLEDKEVTLSVNGGYVKLSRRFKLKDMIYNGKLSL